MFKLPTRITSVMSKTPVIKFDLEIDLKISVDEHLFTTPNSLSARITFNCRLIEEKEHAYSCVTLASI